MRPSLSFYPDHRGPTLPPVLARPLSPRPLSALGWPLSTPGDDHVSTWRLLSQPRRLRCPRSQSGGRAGGWDEALLPDPKGPKDGHGQPEAPPGQQEPGAGWLPLEVERLRHSALERGLAGLWGERPAPHHGPQPPASHGCDTLDWVTRAGGFQKHPARRGVVGAKACPLTCGRLGARSLGRRGLRAPVSWEHRRMGPPEPLRPGWAPPSPERTPKPGLFLVGSSSSRASLKSPDSGSLLAPVT